MRPNFDRRVAVVLATALVLVACLLLPALASAGTPGTDPAHPLVLHAIPWSQDVTGTLGPINWGTFSDYDLFYQLYMTQGETVSMVASTTVGSANFDIEVFADGYDNGVTQWADHSTDTNVHLTFMASRAGYYDINPMADSAIPCATKITTTTAPPFSLTAVSLSKSTPTKKKAFSVSLKLLGEYDGFTNPVTLVLQKWNGKKYTAYKTYAGKVIASPISWLQFKNSLTLGAAKYQIQASFADAAHAKQSTKWKKFTVK